MRWANGADIAQYRLDVTLEHTDGNPLARGPEVLKAAEESTVRIRSHRDANPWLGTAFMRSTAIVHGPSCGWCTSVAHVLHLPLTARVRKFRLRGGRLPAERLHDAILQGAL